MKLADLELAAQAADAAAIAARIAQLNATSTDYPRAGDCS